MALFYSNSKLFIGEIEHHTTMFKNAFAKLKIFFSNLFSTLKINTKRGIDWTGIDGLANMETAALLVIFLRIMFPFPCCAVLSFLIMTIKCIIDSKKGHKNEKHDMICAIIGVICGVILSMAHAAVIVL